MSSTESRSPLTNGNWKGWLLGIVATLTAAAVTNGIVFQRETRETLVHHEEQLKSIQGRGRDAIIREFTTLSLRIDRLYDLMGEVDRKITTAPEIGRELRERDAAIQRLEKRVEELEKRR